MMAMAPPETEAVTDWRVSCDGGEGALGHPRVWLSLSKKSGDVVCPYCDKRFVMKGFEGAETGDAGSA